LNCFWCKHFFLRLRRGCRVDGGCAMGLVLEDVAVGARRRIAWRLLPFLFVLYTLSFVDRVNIGFAGLSMTGELHFSNEVFGFGAGVLFFGYCLLEIPGAIVAERWSTRKWLAAIMIGWGVLAALTGLIETATQFNAIRFLLGVAEGGFFPAVIVYLTHWFRQGDRAKAVALFMTAIPVSNALGGVVASGLLGLHWLGLSGWRWLLILEGLPAVVGGVVTLFYLTDWPREARWLTAEEREWIAGELERENRAKESAGSSAGRAENMLRTFGSPLVVGLFAAYFFINATGYGLTIWLPKIVQRVPGSTLGQVALMASIPYVCAIPAMIFTGWYVDRTGRHRVCALIAGLMEGVGFGMSQIPGASAAAVVLGFSIAAMGLMSFYPCFWALPSKVLSPRVVPAVCGLLTIANLGGFVGPYAMGFLTDLTGSQMGGVMVLVASSVLAGVCVALVAGTTGGIREL
jgi:ACS family tartrate transporter-like MFS transporter